MGLFDKNSRTGGFMDEIRCDEPSYLIWKWHPAGLETGEGFRENAIRWGSSLRVKDGEVAVFVYKQKDGTMQDFIEGPFDETIKTKNFPVLASIVGLAYEGGTPFQAEVYYINLAEIIQVKYAVPFFDMYDPRFPDFGVPVAIRGTISFNIKDYREFIKLHRLYSFNLEDFQAQIRDASARYAKDIVANVPASHNIPLIQIETKTSMINDAIEFDLGKRLKENFGVNVSAIDTGAVEIDKSSDGYQKLMAVTRDISTAKVEAETKDYVERLRIQREEGQYAIHKQTQSSNIGAFQVEKQAEVGVAGAEALGQMGENGAGDVNLGSGGDGGTGFNPAAMMAGMAVGGAVGQNIAGTMNNMMNGVNQTTQPGAVPPIPQDSSTAQTSTTTTTPTDAYHIAIDGKASGPFNITALGQMVFSGKFSPESLVWKPGMAQWEKAGNIDELSGVLQNSAPPIPPKE